MTFVAGIELARSFYVEVLEGALGEIPHSAALIGEGSDVLGFDSTRSHDHAWGPRAQIFVSPDAVEAARKRVDESLPESFHGLPTRFYRWQTGQVDHHVEVTTLADWLTGWMGFDPRDQLESVTWLTIPQQLLLEVTAGAVFRDDTGELTALRQSLRWYPPDVWLLLMGREWHQIADAEHMVARTAEAGDDVGSLLLATKLARAVMRLGFLQERSYQPYDKWFGTAYARLRTGLDPIPLLSADQSDSRERAMIELLEKAAHRHNSLGITARVEPTIGPYEVGINNATRPYKVLNARRFVQACKDAITDQRLGTLIPYGSVDQLLDMTDTLAHFSTWPRRLRALYLEQTAP